MSQVIRKPKKFGADPTEVESAPCWRASIIPEGRAARPSCFFEPVCYRKRIVGSLARRTTGAWPAVPNFSVTNRTETGCPVCTRIGSTPAGFVFPGTSAIGAGFAFETAFIRSAVPIADAGRTTKLPEPFAGTIAAGAC